MDFKDWRKAPDNTSEESATPKIGRYRGKRYLDYIDEQIREAQARGDFDNLPGAGKPLNLDENPFTGDKAMAYSLLKQNGYAPPEVELAKEIRTRFEKAQEKLEKLRQQRKSLSARRIPPFASEKRAFNDAVEKATAQYDQLLRDLNRKILNLNLITPSSMHMPMFEVEKLVQEFRNSCPPIE
jgi:DnaJ homolog subfamily C member 28